MSILLFLFRTRINNLFSGTSKGIWMSMGGIVASLFAILYGFGLGFLVKLSQNNSDDRVQVVSIVASGLLAIIIFGIVKDFMPSYKRRPNMIPPNAPIVGIQRWAINQVSAMMNIFVIAFLMFTISFGIMSWSSLDGKIWISLFVVIIFIAELCSYVIRSLFEYNIRYKRIYFILTVVLMAIMAAMLSVFHTSMSVWMPWTMLAAWIGLSIAVDLSSTEVRTESTIQKDITNIDQALMMMVFRNDMVRRMLLLGLIMKLVVGIYLYYLINGSTRENNFILWEFKLIFLSPVVIFTYVFGNAWSFFAHLFMNMQRTRPFNKQLFGTYLQLVSIPLAIDLSLVLMGTMIIGLDWGESIGLVVMTQILCVAIGFSGSVFLPKRVEPTATLRRSQIHTGVSIAIIACLILFTTGFAFDVTRWYTFGGAILLSFLTIAYTIQVSEKRVHQLVKVML